MFDNEIELKLNLLLSRSLEESVDLPEDLIEEFGELCKRSLRKQFNKAPEKEFRLRMSNIGQDIRKLHLEKEYGPGKRSPSFKLMVTYGDLIENLMAVLLKASGVKVLSSSGEVVLDVNGEEIRGEYDLIIEKDDGTKLVIDVKSASPWSYDNKFVSYEKLAEGDPFGYVVQGFGYGAAAKERFGGWLALNKVNGDFKFLEVPESVYTEERRRAAIKIRDTVKHFKENKAIPECQGVEEETYYGKATGKKKLGSACKFCEHKEKCHPSGEWKVNETSKAKDKKYEFYL